MAGEFTPEEVQELVKLIQWWIRKPLWWRIKMYWKHGILCPWR